MAVAAAQESTGPNGEARRIVPWRLADEAEVLRLHVLLGPRWTEIAQNLVGRTAIQVKSLCYGKLRAKSFRRPSVLGLYVRNLAAMKEAAADSAAARSEAYALALKQHAPTAASIARILSREDDEPDDNGEDTDQGGAAGAVGSGAVGGTGRGSSAPHGCTAGGSGGGGGSSSRGHGAGYYYSVAAARGMGGPPPRGSGVRLAAEGSGGEPLWEAAAAGASAGPAWPLELDHLDLGPAVAPYDQQIGAGFFQGARAGEHGGRAQPLLGDGARGTGTGRAASATTRAAADGGPQAAGCRHWRNDSSAARIDGRQGAPRQQPASEAVQAALMAAPPFDPAARRQWPAGAGAQRTAWAPQQYAAARSSTTYDGEAPPVELPRPPRQQPAGIVCGGWTGGQSGPRPVHQGGGQWAAPQHSRISHDDGMVADITPWLGPARLRSPRSRWRLGSDRGRTGTGPLGPGQPRTHCSLSRRTPARDRDDCFPAALRSWGLRELCFPETWMPPRGPHWRYTGPPSAPVELPGVAAAAAAFSGPPDELLELFHFAGMPPPPERGLSRHVRHLNDMP
ncbi:hypothetical protein HYH03_011703 [Edaphochlamys debaryana]|uniref:HTH myb-type domain-containing protein n=1 Tax=Edaphochlamys debaryana TaxID=47281 RepID=A0A835XTM5_9CHLO|nr:hypothetical protein HYH03_011703 [Edaphochlamys debaryana]|eukprot:KAG2489901.1 hypothetical protein HYH03_011703 [Edaphochlamys debaryana]